MRLVRNAIATAILFIVKCLLSLRYRITVKGKEELTHLRRLQKGGILFLPNHPAEIDPVIVMSILGSKFHPCPLVVEHFYYGPGLSFFMKLVNALPVPSSIASTNKWKLKQVEKLYANVANRLKRGDNFLIYPAGRLKLGGLEILGGTSLAHNLIQACPNAKIVLVRTTGLWGSLFSRALTGRVPSFGKSLFEGFKILLKNGIFFVPRREVKVEFAVMPMDFALNASRTELNRYLEDWYNRYPEPGPEPLKLVSTLFWKTQLPTVAPPSEEKVEQKEVHVPSDVERKIYEQLSQISHRSISEIDRNMHLSLDLGLDSLDMAQLFTYLDEHYDIENLRPGEAETVEDLLKVAVGEKIAKEHEEGKEELPFWPKEKNRLPPFSPLGETLPEAFLLTAERMRSSIACGDATTGVLRYSKLKKTIIVLASKFREFPGDYVGILLPSSVAVNTLILACLLANKIPVMLNWTVGVRALDHAVKLLDFKVVLSSYRFLSKLANGDIGSLEERLILLEDFRKTLLLKDKIKGLLLSFKRPKKLLSYFGSDKIRTDDPAVILFTSGTETLPKAVPLTHGNLLSNQRAALSCAELWAKDILLGALPPFHSFGFSVTGILPLLAGLKVCYSPDPTDSQTLIRDTLHWKATLFCSTPSFIKAMFSIAKKDELKSLRLIVSGAEKTPQELFSKWESFGENKRMIEGYGITECGPIVTLNRLNEPRIGVGKPLPQVELCIIDHDTNSVLEGGEEGEICIHGPNVFPGYLGDVPSPFVSLNGKKWYRSGDRGRIDKSGNLILSGRLKRFIKIGGEMVSLSGLEEELYDLAQKNNWKKKEKESEGPTLAVSVREKEVDKPLIILFTTLEISKEEVNSALKSCGYGKIVKIAEVKYVPQIPTTGTGKTHYRLLDETIS